MKIVFYLLMVIFFIPNKIIAQNKPIRYNPLEKPNTYRNKDNPNYWANKKPNSEYWQQDVYYKIEANIDEKNDIIQGNERLTYWNNSPDDLNVVYFHLYQNAFHPESNHHKLYKQNKIKLLYGQYEKENKGTVIKEISSEGRKILLELDNTILKVHLNKAIKSGEYIVFDIKFITYFSLDNMDLKMKKIESNGKTHYDGINWYPRISVYDSKFGWTTDQHLGKKFYGDFGTFDVELTFSSNYIVEATGFLLNREEVLPKDLKSKLDIKNFKDKPSKEAVSEITPYNSQKRKTWKFHAENVDDFAFTADPSYRIGEAIWNGIYCYAMVKEQNAAKWQNTAKYAAKIIKVFSEDFGIYTYHKIIVADSQNEMEYPMLSLVRGSELGYRSMLVNKISHNWFYGQLGNNETYRASIDKGFTQFLTSWGLEKIEGEVSVQKNNTPRLNIHSDQFNSDFGESGGYKHVYYKTPTMLDNLQYTLGDDLFLNAMKNYFKTWKIAHPYFEDFRKSIINYTKVDLNWFFDQWLESTKYIDYAVKRIKQVKNSDDSYKITFKRKGEMQMPIDFQVYDKSGDTLDFHIPNTWFVKKTNAKILDKWYGFGKIYPEHTVVIKSIKGIKDVKIDPSNRLADSYMIDNSLYKNISIELKDFVWTYPDWKNYEITVRPRFAYNGFDGIKTGIRLTGDYMDYHHKIDGTFWVNTGINQIPEHLPSIDVNFKTDSSVLTEKTYNIGGYERFSYELKYQTGLNKVMKGLIINTSSRQIDGLNLHTIGFKQIVRNGADEIYIEYKALNRPKIEHFAYLLNPEEDFFATNKWNNTINIAINHQYKYFKGNGRMELSLRSSSMGSDYQYSQLTLKNINSFKISKFKLKTRFFAQHATGSDIAPESKLFAAGANPESMMENITTRSTGIISREWVSFSKKPNHFHIGGGLNLRGYSGYLMPEGENIDQIISFNGTSGTSFSAELEFNNYLRFTKRLNMKTYGFIDMGIINTNTIEHKLNLGSFRMDFGIGFTFKIFENINNIKPIILRLDLPWFMNKPPYQETYFNLNRFVIGINRSF